MCVPRPLLALLNFHILSILNQKGSPKSSRNLENLTGIAITPVQSRIIKTHQNQHAY